MSEELVEEKETNEMTEHNSGASNTIEVSVLKKKDLKKDDGSE